MTPIDETNTDSSLGALPDPAIDPAFSARVQRRARAVVRDRGPLRLDLGESAVPLVLILAGIFYTAASIEVMARIFGG